MTTSAEDLIAIKAAEVDLVSDSLFRPNAAAHACKVDRIGPR